MPIVRIIQISQDTKIGIWHIAEPEEFFRTRVHAQLPVSHLHKRLQHLAARYLLAELYPEFPLDSIRITSSGKPWLPLGSYHFSLSHCGDHAAAIVSRKSRVGVDIEYVSSKVSRVAHKFLDQSEFQFIDPSQTALHQTICWCIKEAVFKWHGEGGVDFQAHIRLHPFKPARAGIVRCSFLMPGYLQELVSEYSQEHGWSLAWVSDEPIAPPQP